MQETLAAVYPEHAQNQSSATPSTAGRGRVSQRHLAKLDRFLASILETDPVQDPPYVVWVAGELGVGKSTLVCEVRERSRGVDLAFATARAHAHAGEILEPVLGLARTLIDLARSRAAAGDERWQHIWNEIVTRHAGALDRVLPEVDWGRVVEPLPSLDPEYERCRLIDHLGGIFLRVAERVPTILHIDGGEHLDALGRQLLTTLGGVLRARSKGRKARLPLPPRPRLALVLCTESEEECPLDLPETELLSFALRGLGRDEFGKALADELGEEIPLSIREKLYQLTRGNPLDLEHRFERVRRQGGYDSALAGAKLLLELGRYEFDVTQELKRVERPARFVLNALTVLGKPISPPILVQVTRSTPEELSACVDSLVEGGWVTKLPSGAISLRNERVQRMLDESLSARERGELHARAADAIEQEYQQRPHRRFQEVYYHRTRAPGAPGAVEAGFLAADEAFRLCDYPTALRIYGEVLDRLHDDDADRLVEGLTHFTELLADHRLGDEKSLTELEGRIEHLARRLDGERLAGLWRRLGLVAGRRGIHDKELAFYRRGLDVVSGASRSGERLLLLASIAASYLGSRSYDETLRYCREGIEVATLGDVGDDPEFLELCRVTQEAHFHRGELVEALDFEERFHALAKVQGTSQQVFDSLLRLAFMHEHRGQEGVARARLEEAVPIARATGSRLLAARIDERLGYLHARSENWSEATAAFQRAFQAQAELGNEERTTRILGALGMVALFHGDPVAGAHYFRLHALYQSLRERTELPPTVPGLPCDYRGRSERDDEIRVHSETVAKTGRVPARVLVSALSELADLRRDRGEFQSARALLRRGLRIALEEQLDVSGFYLQLGILSQLQGEVGQALEFLQKGLDALAEFPERERIAETNLQVGLLYLGRGRFGSALKFLMRGLRSYLELEHEPGVAHALIELGHAYRSLGRADAAEELGLAALALAESLSIDRLEAEAWLLLATVRRHGNGPTPGHQEVALARELFGKLGILEGRCRALLVEAEIFERWADPNRALALCSESLEIARDLGLQPLMALGLAVRGSIETSPELRTDFGRALNTLESALDHALGVGSCALELRIRATLAEAFHRRSRQSVTRQHLTALNEKLNLLLEDCPLAYRESLIAACPGIGLLRMRESEARSSLPAAQTA
ncbi:MAG: AAA family ATPase [Planctomycetota bacterium]